MATTTTAQHLIPGAIEDIETAIKVGQGISGGIIWRVQYIVQSIVEDNELLPSGRISGGLPGEVRHSSQILFDNPTGPD